MTKLLSDFLYSATAGRVSLSSRYKACRQCRYLSKDCKNNPHCQTRSQAEGVVWHLGEQK
ncbi:hypothetical protein [Desulforamulus ruminis]|uniref:Uncharacterized protein n=1 Tax=Desulforamulus ruminis (strain ATCC 23193 / DSM 2154 / NCIMB 8452 / DL) TaxID=696281 RepID=F6DVH7_DESRL|nr:hypothetical protein [Desulforamulus ruminis]AEG61437.1 hypothetical protein Desru_3231 [Desulforamulus ruminis DSM 2154]